MARVVTGTNFALAAAALLLLAIAAQAEGARAPFGAILAVPMAIVQIAAGLVPAILCVRRDRLVGTPRRWLLWPPLAGLAMSGVAAAVSLLTCGGC